MFSAQLPLVRSAFDSGRLIRNRHTYARQVVGQYQLRALDDRRSGRLASPGRAVLDVGVRREPAVTGRAGSTGCTRNAGFAGSPVRIISYANATTTSSTWRVHGRPARRGAEVMAQSEPSRTSKRTSAPTAVGIAPIFHRALPPFGRCDMKDSANGLTPQRLRRMRRLTTGGYSPTKEQAELPAKSPRDMGPTAQGQRRRADSTEQGQDLPLG